MPDVFLSLPPLSCSPAHFLLVNPTALSLDQLPRLVGCPRLLTGPCTVGLCMPACTSPHPSQPPPAQGLFSHTDPTVPLPR